MELVDYATNPRPQYESKETNKGRDELLELGNKFFEHVMYAFFRWCTLKRAVLLPKGGPDQKEAGGGPLLGNTI